MAILTDGSERTTHVGAKYASGDGRLILSTDKALYPINAVGMTKAMMEKLTVAKSRWMGAGEEAPRAENLGDYFRIPADTRSLNYAFQAKPEIGEAFAEGFTSANTRRLNGDEGRRTSPQPGLHPERTVLSLPALGRGLSQTPRGQPGGDGVENGVPGGPSSAAKVEAAPPRGGAGVEPHFGHLAHSDPRITGYQSADGIARNSGPKPSTQAASRGSAEPLSMAITS